MARIRQYHPSCKHFTSTKLDSETRKYIPLFGTFLLDMECGLRLLDQKVFGVSLLKWLRT
jgi:hypothetical protein